MNEEKIAFIQNILKWQKGSYVLSEQKCFIVNFGYKKPLDYPTVDYQDFPNFPFDFKAPSKCSIVVIEGRYLEQIDEVMKMVDKIPWMPLAVFLMAEKPGQDIKFNVSTRHRRSPTMYQVPASRSSVVQFVMTCPGMSHSSTFTLHMRDSGEVDDGKVWGDLCREKKMTIAYNNDWFSFEFNEDTGEMVKYDHRLWRIDEDQNIPHYWEILETFFTDHHITNVSWTNCNLTWGRYDQELGRWTGAVGEVSSTEYEGV